MVIVTLGVKGAYVYGKDGGKRISGFVANVVDTIGAGDVFYKIFVPALSKWKTSSRFDIERTGTFYDFWKCGSKPVYKKRECYSGNAYAARGHTTALTKGKWMRYMMYGGGFIYGRL